MVRGNMGRVDDWSHRHPDTGVPCTERETMKKKALNVPMTSEMRQAVKEQAKNEYCSEAAVARKALAQYLREQNAEEVKNEW